MEAFIKLNGNPYPQPARGLELQEATIVDSGRNANGAVVGQKVGRNQTKINNLSWPILTAEQWSAILHELDNFFVQVTYFDMYLNDWTTKTMYPGDRSATPFRFNDATGKPQYYINCKFNLIDTGA